MGSIKIKTATRQELVLTLAMQEALSILAMPLPSLAEWLQEQIEQNPALQFSERKFEFGRDRKHSTFDLIEHTLASPITLQDHLLAQARETLSSPDDLKEMETLIGNLNERGLMEETDANPRLLTILQSFDPPGIGATCLQQSFLLQLERKNEKDTLAYRLVQDHYHDLIHKKRELICKSLPCRPEELQALIESSLSTLSLNPAAAFERSATPVQVPDIFIELSKSGWSLTLNESLLPKFHLNETSLGMGPFETSAQWIEKMLTRRGEIITNITKVVLKVQSDFFHGKTSDLQPLTFREIAEKLKLHESTISRAVKDKYLSCSRGIFQLRFFFSQKTAKPEISCHTAKERLKTLIQMESKEKPLSDKALSEALCKQGVRCARRTVAKYRKNLNIPPASERSS